MKIRNIFALGLFLCHLISFPFVATHVDFFLPLMILRLLHNYYPRMTNDARTEGEGFP